VAFKLDGGPCRFSWMARMKRVRPKARPSAVANKMAIIREGVQHAEDRYPVPLAIWRAETGNRCVVPYAPAFDLHLIGVYDSQRESQAPRLQGARGVSARRGSSAVPPEAHPWSIQPSPKRLPTRSDQQIISRDEILGGEANAKCAILGRISSEKSRHVQKFVQGTLMLDSP